MRAYPMCGMGLYSNRCSAPFGPGKTEYNCHGARCARISCARIWDCHWWANMKSKSDIHSMKLTATASIPNTRWKWAKLSHFVQGKKLTILIYITFSKFMFIFGPETNGLETCFAFYPIHCHLRCVWCTFFSLEEIAKCLRLHNKQTKSLQFPKLTFSVLGALFSLFAVKLRRDKNRALISLNARFYLAPFFQQSWHFYASSHSEFGTGNARAAVRASTQWSDANDGLACVEHLIKIRFGGAAFIRRYWPYFVHLQSRFFTAEPNNFIDSVFMSHLGNSRQCRLIRNDLLTTAIGTYLANLRHILMGLTPF